MSRQQSAMSAEETRISDKREKDMKDNNNLPWGVLTGIRPSKIAAKLILGGMSERDAAQYFVDNYNAFNHLQTKNHDSAECIEALPPNLLQSYYKRVQKQKEKLSFSFLVMPSAAVTYLKLLQTSAETRW